MGNAALLGERYFPNALGRNNIADPWMPICVDDAGVQRDRSGLRIVPFEETKDMTHEQIQSWLKKQNVVLLNPFKLGA